MSVSLCRAAAAAAAAMAVLAAPSGAAEPAHVSLADLVQQAAKTEPQLAVCDAQIAAAQAQVAQAGRWADPAIAVEVGQRHQPGDDDLHARIEVLQPLPWAGQAAGRAAPAQAQRAAAMAAKQAALRQLDGELRSLADAVQRTRAARDAAAAQQVLAQAVLTEVETRLARAEATPADQARALLEVAEARQAQQVAVHQADAAWAALAARAGVALPANAELHCQPLGELTRDSAVARAAQHADVLAAAAALAQTEAEISAAQAEAKPGLGLGVFYERDGDADDVGLLLECSAPLWGGTRDAVLAARASAQAAQAQYAQALAQAQRNAASAWDAWHGAATAAALGGELLPAAEQVHSTVLAAYTRGEASLGDVLDARRSLVRMHQAAISAAAEASAARTALELVAPPPLEMPLEVAP